MLNTLYKFTKLEPNSKTKKNQQYDDPLLRELTGSDMEFVERSCAFDMRTIFSFDEEVLPDGRSCTLVTLYNNRTILLKLPFEEFVKVEEEFKKILRKKKGGNMSNYYDNQQREAIADIMQRTGVSERRATDIYTALYNSGLTTPGYARLILDSIPVNGDHCYNLEETREAIYSYLTEQQYMDQLSNPNSEWYCPCTNQLATFDDQFFEALHGI